jgi:hypothetical protein
MIATWRELEAQGVKRCCAMFTNGGRCRRRAVEAWDYDYCAKHGPIITVLTAKHMAVIKRRKRCKGDGD